MGLKIHSLAEIPESVSRSFYLYVLDYYNWDEPIGNTLRQNFDRIAEFASKNDAVVIQGVGESHFYSELLSFDGINGKKPKEMLPALMITTIHPNYFLSRNEQRCEGEPIPQDEIVFIRLRDTCKQPTDVLLMLEKIFEDIKNGQRLRDFQVAEEQKRGRGGALANSLILEPNFAGVGVDLKRLWSALCGSSE
ncbi:MAG TPA: hypothetical protein DDZ51_30085 [Planctomycetaceae bacterium]|nr:hypothetical protein [Planctomycetaceae bacterium]